MTVSCTAESGYIKKPRVKTDHYTPEVMRLMGKVSDPQPSPDGTKILYDDSISLTDVSKELIT